MYGVPPNWERKEGYEKYVYQRSPQTFAAMYLIFMVARGMHDHALITCGEYA